MQQVTISEVKSKPTKPRKDGTTGTFTQITTTTGAKASGFDATLANLQKGDVIEWEVITEGEFLNIKDWKLVTKAADRPSVELEKEAKAMPSGSDKEVSMAVSYIKDLMVAKIVPVEHALAVLAMSWCASRLVAAGVKPHGIFADDPSAEKGEAPKMATVAAPAQGKGIKPEAVSPVEQGKTVIKTAADLWRWAQDKGLTIADIRQITGQIGPTSSRYLPEEYVKLLAEIKKRHEEAK